MFQAHAVRTSITLGPGDSVSGDVPPSGECTQSNLPPPPCTPNMAEMEAELSWKEKYEKSENSLANLKKLAHKAVADYEDLLRKYDQNQKQYEDLKQRLVDTEKQLSDLQNVLEPVYDEYSNLNHRYKLEQVCRSEAESYATKVTRENKQLKRQSQLFVQSLSGFNVDVTKMVEATENLADISNEDQIDHLNHLIEDLQGQVVKLQHQVKKTREERDEAVEREKVTEIKYQQELQTTTWQRQALEHHENQLKQFKRVSLKAFNEYGELINKFDTERKLKEEAERYASVVLSERDAIARESSALIGSANQNDQLRKALLQIEELNKALETERTAHKQKMRDIEEEMTASKDMKQMTELENQLQAASEQIEQLTKQVSDVNSWNDKLNKRNTELENKLDVTAQKLDIAEQKLKPPPPPPPPPLPPDGFFQPLKILIKKSRGIKDPPPGQEKKVDQRQEKYSEALEEMMRRIKSGTTTLRPAGQRRPSLPEDSTNNNGTAMNDLHSMLSTMKSRSRSQGHIHDSSSSNDSELAQTFRRIVGTSTDSPAFKRDLSNIEEVEEKESLSSEDNRLQRGDSKKDGDEVFV